MPVVCSRLTPSLGYRLVAVLRLYCRSTALMPNAKNHVGYSVESFCISFMKQCWLFREKWLILLENVGVVYFEMLEKVVLSVLGLLEKCTIKHEA